MLSEAAEAEGDSLRIAMVRRGEQSPDQTQDGTLRTSFQSHGSGAGFADWPSFGTLDWVNHIHERNSFDSKDLGRLVCWKRRGQDGN
jgi:hypothetical protein